MKDQEVMQSQKALVQAVVEYSKKNLGHLFTLNQEQVANVLEALSWYCSQEGNKSQGKKILLRRLAYEQGDVGHRFETWAL